MSIRLRMARYCVLVLNARESSATSNLSPAVNSVAGLFHRSEVSALGSPASARYSRMFFAVSSRFARSLASFSSSAVADPLFRCR